MRLIDGNAEVPIYYFVDTLNDITNYYHEIDLTSYNEIYADFKECGEYSYNVFLVVL